MIRVRYLLVADGSSDKALQHVINWLLRELLPHTPIEAFFSDPRMLGSTPPDKNPLQWKIERSLKRHLDIDILFVHRDAEREPPQNRFDEIKTAIDGVSDAPLHVCVVPVRMTEAWFLIDESAIRYAASNPNGKVKLELPSLKKIEDLPDPKSVLHDLLRQASELRGRRLKNFNVYQVIHRLAELTADYSPLRELSAFQQFETDLSELLNSE
jgi:hypothetical protein